MCQQCSELFYARVNTKMIERNCRDAFFRLLYGPVARTISVRRQERGKKTEKANKCSKVEEHSFARPGIVPNNRTNAVMCACGVRIRREKEEI